MSKGYLESFVGIIFIFLILTGIVILFEWKGGNGDDSRTLVQDKKLHEEVMGHSPYILLPLLMQEREGITVLDELVAASLNGSLQDTVTHVNTEIIESGVGRDIYLIALYADQGIRGSEMVYLEELDVPLEHGVLHIAAVKSSVYPEVGGGV